MTYDNLDQIKREFNILENDPEEIRKKLRGLLADLHPDKNGGQDFASLEDKEKYFRANEADQFLEKLIKKPSAIVPSNEMTELVKLVRDLVLVDKKLDKVANFESRLTERVDQGLSQLGRQYLAPRITVSAISTALTFVWLLPGTISEHPVLKNYISINDSRFVIIWLMSILLTIIVLFGTSASEEREKRFQSRLKTEVYQNRALERYLDSTGNHFAKSDFIRFLTTKYIPLNAKPNLPFSTFFSQIIGRPLLVIDPETAQLIADVVFERAEHRGVIQKAGKARQIEEVYTKTDSEVD